VNAIEEEKWNAKKKPCHKKQRCPIPKCAKRAFALSDKFGDDPEKYRQFVEETKDKNFCDVVKLWKDNHKECQDACMKKKAGRLAFICKDTTNNMIEIIKKHPDMSFREILKMTCKEKGI